jgi:hypothetical protein
MSPAPVRELQAAERAVVEWEAKQEKEEPDRVAAHGIDLVHLSQTVQIDAVASRTEGVPGENTEDAAVVVEVRVAGLAMEGGGAKNASQRATRLA